MTGGYIMIDASGVNLLSETAQTKAGIYHVVETAMGLNKPMFAYGMLWGDLVITPIPVFAIKFSDNTIICTSSTLQVIITSSDEITVNNLAPEV